MASAAVLTDSASSTAQAWLEGYCREALAGDVVRGARHPAHWLTLFEQAARASNGDLARLRSRVQRQADEIGTGFRLPGDSDERKWPLSPLPMLIGESEWSAIADGVAQRADLMEMLLADIYGNQRLSGNGLLPAALLNGSPHFLRPMVGLAPPGGRHLHFYAVDIGRGPGGEWRVLADHTRTPTGAGYALENRLAVTRVLAQLQSELNVLRLAPFFADVRAGIAAACQRAEPRIGLLTPGRFNPSYAEQAHIARYLGLLLVEGEDLAVHDDRLYLRTIEGLKRVDALWRRVDPRLLDPLAFDSRSRIGVPGLIDAMASGNVVIANSPGAGVLESPAFAAFIPRLSVRLTGEDLRIPNIATWWCGQDAARDTVLRQLDSMVVAPAFQALPMALPDGPAIGSSFSGAGRDALVRDMSARGLDYVGQETVRLSTTPGVEGDRIVPRPFTLRVFAARAADGRWTVMPGGFARLGDTLDVRAAMLGEGAYSTDVAIISDRPVPPVTLMPEADAVVIRRNPGTLPSRVADNLFWLGRYLERAESVLALVRAALGGSVDVDGGAALAPATLTRLGRQLIASGAAEPEGSATDVVALARSALENPVPPSSLPALLRAARAIGEGSRERLSTDVWRLLDAPMPVADSPGAVAAALYERFAALSGLSAENMGRTAGWRFLDLGRRIERGIGICRLLRNFARDGADADDLGLLVELTNSQIGYRQRYPTGLALVPVRDLVALDATNPRGLAFQVEAATDHLNALPRLNDDGMAELQQVEAVTLSATLATLGGWTLNDTAVQGLENRLLSLADAIGRRFFLRGRADARCGADAGVRFRILHETRFTYAAPVRFARCNLRLKPIIWSGQTLVEHDLAVAPPGVFSLARADASLANVTRLTLDDAVTDLRIISTAVVDVDRDVPMPSSSDPALAAVARLARESRDLSAASPANYLFPSPMIPLDPAIGDWCASSLDPTRGALDAMLDLARRIQADFTYDPDATKTETPPSDAFARRTGVCQDFAQVMISGLRSAGLPAAYVSGYIRTLPPEGQPRLVGADATHAWVLMWCGPALGWVGVDPTNGIWMAGDHIVTAIGRDYSEVAPIDGIFLGQGAQTMRVGVDVEPLIDALAAHR